jgi:hypothetical protein
MGNIGKVKRIIQVEPVPEEVPVTVPEEVPEEERVPANG